jgi:23S rRNA (guanosine2251-2'-O)-methyltransferase
VCDDIFMTKAPRKPNSNRKNSTEGKRAAQKPRANSKSRDDTNFQTLSKQKRFEGKPSRGRNGEERKIPPRPAKTRRHADTATKASKVKADLFGMHAVREAWQNPKRYVHALFVTENALKELGSFLETSLKRPEPTIVSKDEIDRALPNGTVHQGIAMSCQALAETGVIDLIIKAESKPTSVIVMLDQVTDPHNIGAILRSACAFGADGVVMQSKHAPEMTGILAKTACGALEHIPVAYETNLSRALDTLKEHHYTVIGLDEHSPKTFKDLRSYDRVVMVLGAEGSGIRRLIKEHCDVLVTLPTKPPIASLNVSNAAAVALYALTK